MEFGRVADVSGIDFSLADDAFFPRARFLSRPSARRDARVYLGCAVWADPSFLSTVYPAHTPRSKMLEAYGAQFGAVEVNSSFYHVPPAHTISRWCEVVPAAFRFCPKLPRAITHAAPGALQGAGRDAATVRAEFSSMREALNAFGDKLGVTFVQLPPSLGPQDKRVVAQLVARLTTQLVSEQGDPHRFALELRHPDWFHDRALFGRLSEFLHEQGIGLVITDTAGRRDAVHMAVPVPHVFIRFLGNGLHASDFSRLDAWADRLAQWLDAGVRDVSMFIHQPNKTHAATLIQHMTKRLRGLSKVWVFEPQPIEPVQRSLF